MVVWPENKGPLAGRCPACNGQVVLWVGGIQKIYKCTKCGLLSDTAGARIIIPGSQVRKIVDEVWDALGLPWVSTQTFLSTVDKVCCDRLGGHVQMITRQQFRQWGYTANSTRLQKGVTEKDDN